MPNVDAALLDKITEALHRILTGGKPTAVPLAPDHPDDEVRQVVTYINRLIIEYGQMADVANALSLGRLDLEMPKGKMLALHSLKNLHANLRHLTWKTQEIARGDFTQRVDFIGDFSVAFNGMTDQLRDAFEKIQQSYRRLSELERLRDSLVHMVVHDLRSPLLGLSGCLQMLQSDLQGKLEAEQAEDLESALTAAQRLSEMVTSLLDVSRLEAGQMPLHKQACDVRTVIAGAIESLGGLTRGRRVSFAPSDAPIVLSCDGEITARIVANLIGNALKFTPATGEVRVTATLEGNEVKVAVADTGPGIPVEYRERIFDKFGQVEGRQEGRKHSTGLGLTFCKLAAEAHGGTIGVDSEVGRGSTFWFRLPVQ